MGIEPTRPAWKAGILPLNYTRTLPRATLIIILNSIEKVNSFCKKNLFFSKLFYISLSHLFFRGSEESGQRLFAAFAPLL